MTETTETMEPEWSNLFAVEKLEDTPMTLTISPEASDYEGLARRLNITSLDKLQANVKIERIAGSATIHVDGTIEADITQKCVVSSEPTQSQITERFEAWYAEESAAVSLTKKRQEKMLAKGHTEIPLVEERDDPEPVIDGAIDLGELITQYLSLGISPYPRAEGATYENPISDEENDAFSFKNPFAGLKDWKDKLTSKE